MRRSEFDDAIDFEVSLADVRRRSERRAWFLAMLFGVLLALSVVGYFVLLPLKQTVPFVVMADTHSGQATVARLAGSLPASLSSNEALDRANIANFVRARESYDASLLGDRDWGLVFSMAVPAVVSAYRRLHDPTNASQPYKVYGTQSSLRIRIVSLQMNPAAAAPSNRTATVRFSRYLFDKAMGTERLIDHKIAQVEYRYDTALKLQDQDRLLNPLGFRVEAYRVDNDYAATETVHQPVEVVP